MKKLLLLKSLLLLCALVVGTSAWADGPVVIYSETFGSPASNTDISSFTGWSATASMFNLTGTETVASCYSGNKVGKGDASTDYTAASGSGNAFQQGTANTTTTILTVQKINISGKTSLSFNAGLRNGGAATYIKVYYQIDNGTKTEITLTGYGATTGWHYVSGSISGTGTNLKLFFEQKPTKTWTSRIDDIKVTGVSGGGSTVSTPTFNHGTDTYTTAQNVELSCLTDGATIHYTMTTDGSTPNDPTESDPTYTTTPISVTLSGTKIKAKAFKAGSTASSVASATYTIQPDKPTFTVSTVVTGKVNRGAQLTMSAATGNDIIYTTDGTAASYSVPNGDIYDSPITINNPMTIKAIAVDGYGNESQQAIETYAIYYAGGVDIIPNYTFFGKNDTYSGTTYSEVSGTKDGITITHSKGTGDNTYADGNSMRFYPKNTLTIEAPVGKTITNIVFTQANGQEDDMTSTPSGYSATTKTWTGDAASVTFTRTGSSYLKFTNIEVVLANKATIAAACTDGEGMYYGTYSSAKAFKVPSALVVSEIKVDNGKLQLSDYATGAVVPANTGVMIASDVAGSYTLEIATGGTSVLGSDNMLKPSGDAGITAANMTEADTKFYRLTMHNGSEIGFWWGADDGAAFDLAANKAYLAVPNSPQLSREGLWFGDDVTAIETVKTQQADGQYFNIAGQRVAQPTKGLYIVNGKKVIIK